MKCPAVAPGEGRCCCPCGCRRKGVRVHRLMGYCWFAVCKRCIQDMERVEPLVPA